MSTELHSEAVDALVAAFRTSVERFGRKETMISAIAIVTASAVQWRQPHVYCDVLRANAAILEDAASRCVPIAK